MGSFAKNTTYAPVIPQTAQNRKRCKQCNKTMSAQNHVNNPSFFESGGFIYNNLYNKECFAYKALSFACKVTL